MKRIEEFQGEYRWLSNFVKIKAGVTLKDGLNIIYPTTEHAYQAAKLKLPARLSLVKTTNYLTMTAGEVKKLARTFGDDMDEDWEDRKLRVMVDLQRQKFSTDQYRKPLIATTKFSEDGEVLGLDPSSEYDRQENYMMLEEGNKWGDRFWGIDLKRGGGLNHLGKIIMQVRNEIICERNKFKYFPKWQTWCYEG